MLIPAVSIHPLLTSAPSVSSESAAVPLAPSADTAPPSPASAPSVSSESAAVSPAPSADTAPPASAPSVSSESAAAPPEARTTSLSLPIINPLLSFNGATHAERNPSGLIQPSQPLTKLTDAQKATRKIQQENKRRAQELLGKDLDQLLTEHREELEDLARRHGKKVEAIDKLILTSSHFKHKRSVNIENAKIHMKSQEVNADLSTGDRVRLPEIRAMVREDQNYQNLTKEQEQEMKDEVMALRQQKKVGARPTNQSAALDYRRHLTSLNDEITSLSQRTGASVVAFFSRSHMEDVFEPNWICTPNAANFVQDTLGQNMWDITRLFELWNCSKAKIRNPDCLASMRTECSATINGTLKTVSQLPKAVMNYANYDTQVVQKYQCKIVGWTFNRFVSPFDINTVDDLRTLRDALRCGACFWVRMTRAEVSKHAADLLLREASGEVTGKKRKQRSDKGIKKGSRAKQGVKDKEDSSDASDNEEEAGPSKKKKRTAQQKPAAKTKVKRTTTAKTGKKKTKSNGKDRSSKSQLPPSNRMITDTEDEPEEDAAMVTEPVM